jgi:ATP-dependent DNA ligase
MICPSDPRSPASAVTLVPKKALPQFVAPKMASSSKEPFNDPDWIFETKLDGYRAITVIDSTGKARIWSRNRLPLEQKVPTVEMRRKNSNFVQRS